MNWKVRILLAIIGASVGVFLLLLWMDGVFDSSLSKPQPSLATNNNPSDNSEAAVDFIVEYSEDGFVPQHIEVGKGTRIGFRNTIDTLLWVGSDPHPLHSDYPVLDAKRGYAKNEMYVFTFEKTGTFGYHNHEHAHDRGVIQVVDNDKPTLVIDKTLPGQEAIRDRLIALLKPEDPDSIFVIIDELQKDPALKVNCHDIAHDIGHRAYTMYGFSEAMTFNNPEHVDHPLVQYICAGGYMHGILEQLSLHNPDFLTSPDSICATLPLSDRDSCYHGVGHVFMLARTRDVDSAIQDCRQVEDLTYTYRCFEGVRMEQFWGNIDHVATSSLGWIEKDPLGPCVAAETDERPTCFLYSTFGYLRYHPKDYFGAVNLCTNSNLPESDVQFCLKGLGITMMSKFQGKNLEGSETYVAGLSVEQRNNFYRGVLGYAHLSGVSRRELETTCASFTMDSLLCFNVLEEIY